MFAREAWGEGSDLKFSDIISLPPGGGGSGSAVVVVLPHIISLSRSPSNGRGRHAAGSSTCS